MKVIYRKYFLKRWYYKVLKHRERCGAHIAYHYREFITKKFKSTSEKERQQLKMPILFHKFLVE